MQNKYSIEAVKKLRLQVDGLTLLLDKQTKLPYMATKMSLLLAKAWMGKILGALEEPTPYTNDGKRNSVKDIEPTADTVEVIDAIIKSHPDTKYPLTQAFVMACPDLNALVKKEKGFTYYSDLEHVQKVDWLREQIKKVTIAFLRMPPVSGILVEKCVTNVYTHLSEARFHLGFELQRLRETQQKENV